MTTNQYKLVPVEPTEEMVMTALAGFDFNDNEEDLTIKGIKETWKDMLASAPVIPSAEGDDYDEDAAKRLRAILSMLGIGAPESDEQMMLCQFSLFGMMRHKIKQLYTAPQPSPDAAARIAELEAEVEQLKAFVYDIFNSTPPYSENGLPTFKKRLLDKFSELTDKTGKMICKCRPFKRGREIPGASVTAFGVHHKDDGLIYTAPTRELANDHINDCLSDPELREYGKGMWLVEVKYSLPMELWPK